VINHNVIVKKLNKLSLNFRKRLNIILQNKIVLINFEKLFISVCDVDEFEIAHKSVKDDFTLIVND